MSNWVGKRLGKVQIESLIGRGGVAEVYLGTHTTLERKVAVKILRNLTEEDSDELDRFQREARVIAKFRHPNIVQVHDFDTVENNPYLVMEYIEGPSLSKYLRALHQKNERLEPPQIARLLNRLASALQYAHSNGVIHRDVKPGNVLLTSPSSRIIAGEPLPADFEPILTDFGLVRLLDSKRQTATGQIAGTPAYISPEQARGKATDGRTDVYSLGIVLYEMLAGHIPFDGESTMSILLKHVTESPDPIPGLSPVIQNVLDRALAKEVEDRFQTPIEFANAFSAVVDMQTDPSTLQMNTIQFEVPPLKTEQPVEKAAEQPAKPKARWLQVGLLAAIAIAVAGFVLINGRQASLPENITETVAIPSATYTIPPATLTSTPSVLGPSGLLRFQNGAALADQASLIVRALPAPPAGTQYEIWLTGSGKRISLGFFSPDDTGSGELSFLEPEGLNLLARYDELEITMEPNPDDDPEPSELLAYSFALPEEGLIHLRYLLSSFPKTPNKVGLIQGLHADIERIDQLAKEIENTVESGDKAGAQGKAEDALNLLVGGQSADYKDWNGDGQMAAKSSSYGLLLNGNSFGYIQAVFAEAEYIVNTPDATQYMIENGAVVKTCAQNLGLWMPQLRELLLTILTSTSDSEISAAARDLVALTGQILAGTDLDNNGTIDTISRECSAETAYEYAYYMADMPVLPVSISYQLTVVADPNYVIPTRTRDASQNNQGGNTPKPHPTKKPNPTKKPKH